MYKHTYRSMEINGSLPIKLDSDFIVVILMPKSSKFVQLYETRGKHSLEAEPNTVTHSHERDAVVGFKES